MNAPIPVSVGATPEHLESAALSEAKIDESKSDSKSAAVEIKEAKEQPLNEQKVVPSPQTLEMSPLATPTPPVPTPSPSIAAKLASPTPPQPQGLKRFCVFDKVTCCCFFDKFFGEWPSQNRGHAAITSFIQIFFQFARETDKGGLL